MDLFYVAPRQLDLDRSRALIDGDEFHHLTRVLRSRVGDSIDITDGAGLTAQMTIDSIGKRSLEGTIRECVRVDRPSTSVTVAISLLKAPHRFDLFLEKATELGVDRIIPMTTRRTVSNPSAEKAERKVDRWRSIVQAAARQCRRFYLPEVCEPLAFADVLLLQGYDIRLIPWESEQRLPAFEPAGRRIIFLVGGEGGFTDEEVAAAEFAGFEPVTFGNTILRAETAGIFAVALVRSLLLRESDPGRRL